MTDLQLALSVAISAEDRDSKDTNMIARVLIKKVQACKSDDILENKESLQYEHFIGPLVILCAVNNLLKAQGSNTGD